MNPALRSGHFRWRGDWIDYLPDPDGLRRRDRPIPPPPWAWPNRDPAGRGDWVLTVWLVEEAILARRNRAAHPPGYPRSLYLRLAFQDEQGALSWLHEFLFEGPWPTPEGTSSSRG